LKQAEPNPQQASYYENVVREAPPVPCRLSRQGSIPVTIVDMLRYELVRTTTTQCCCFYLSR